MKMMIFAFSLMFLTCASAKVEISFDREIEASDRARISLADLATVKGGTGEVAAELSGLAYEGGGAAEIRKTLRDRKAATDLYERLQVQVTVPQEVVVRKVAGYSSQEFRRKLLSILQAGCPDCRMEMLGARDEKIRVGSDWSVGEFQWTPKSSLLIPVISKAANAWIPVQMKISRKALVAKRAFMTGQRISNEDLEEREVDVSRLNGFAVTVADLGEAVAARALAAGTVVQISDLRREQLIKRGQAVKLLSGGEEFEISVNALAEESGGRGDLIKVRNVESGKVLSAVVTERGQARMQ